MCVWHTCKQASDTHTRTHTHTMPADRTRQSGRVVVYGLLRACEDGGGGDARTHALGRAQQLFLVVVVVVVVVADEQQTAAAAAAAAIP